jgi:hypothetical protein
MVVVFGTYYIALMGWGIAAASRMGDIDAEVIWNEEGFVTWWRGAGGGIGANDRW